MRYNKGLWIGLIALATVLIFAGYAGARTVTFVVPWSAGGGSDTMARFIVKSIKDNNLTDANFVVADKPGGNGQIGSAYVIKKKRQSQYLDDIVIRTDFHPACRPW